PRLEPVGAPAPGGGPAAQVVTAGQLPEDRPSNPRAIRHFSSSRWLINRPYAARLQRQRVPEHEVQRHGEYQVMSVSPGLLSRHHPHLVTGPASYGPCAAGSPGPLGDLTESDDGGAEPGARLEDVGYVGNEHRKRNGPARRGAGRRAGGPGAR